MGVGLAPPRHGGVCSVLLRPGSAFCAGAVHGARRTEVCVVPFVSVRRVVQIRLDGRRRPSKPPGDLGDREPLLVAVVARERRSPAPFTYTITCGHAGDDSGRSRRLPNELDSRRWYSETMLGSVVTSKAEHRRFPRIRKSRRVPIRDLALPAVVLLDSEAAEGVYASIHGRATANAFAENRPEAERASAASGPAAAPRNWVQRGLGVVWLVHA